MSATIPPNKFQYWKLVLSIITTIIVAIITVVYGKKAKEPTTQIDTVEIHNSQINIADIQNIADQAIRQHHVHNVGSYTNVYNGDTAIGTTIDVSEHSEFLNIEVKTLANFVHPYYINPVNRFEAGQYTISGENIQKSIIDNFFTFYTNFKQNYNVTPDGIDIDVYGSADGMPVTEGSAYQGDLADENGLIGNPIFITYESLDDKTWYSVNLVKNETPLTNELYALMRGYFLKATIEKYFPDLKGKIKLHTKTYKEIGPQYRAVYLKLKIKNKDIQQRQPPELNTPI